MEINKWFVFSFHSESDTKWTVRNTKCLHNAIWGCCSNGRVLPAKLNYPLGTLPI